MAVVGLDPAKKHKLNNVLFYCRLRKGTLTSWAAFSTLPSLQQNKKAQKRVSELSSMMVHKAVCIYIQFHVFNQPIHIQYMKKKQGTSLLIFLSFLWYCRSIGVSHSCSSHWRTPNELASWLKDHLEVYCCPDNKRLRGTLRVCSLLLSL